MNSDGNLHKERAPLCQFFGDKPILPLELGGTRDLRYTGIP